MGRNGPVTEVVNVEQAMRTLGHVEMTALAALYERWALTEERIDPDRRTRVILMSADYEAIAKHAGPGWVATEPDYPDGIIAFIAKRAAGKPARGPREATSVLTG